MWEWLRRLIGAAAVDAEPAGSASSDADAPDGPAPDAANAEEPAVDPFALDLEQLAIRADWLSERGDPRGLLINAELAGHPDLDRLVARHLPAVLGPLLTVVEVLEVRYGQATEVRLRRMPTEAERASEAWANLDRIEAMEEVRRALDDPRVVLCHRTSRVPHRFVPYRLVRAGLDRQLWLVYDTFTEQPAMIGVPDPNQVIEPDATGLVQERVIGAEIYPFELEALGPQPWPDEVAAVVGDADPAQWVMVEGEPRALGPVRSFGRPVGSGAGWAGLQSRGPVRSYDEDGFFGDGIRFLVLDGAGGHLSAQPWVAEALGSFQGAHGLVDGVEACHRSLLAEEAVGAAAVGAERIEAGFRVCWAGDARAYRVSESGLVPATVDHTLVQQMVDAGRLTPQDPRFDRYRNIITRSLGFDDAAEPEVVEVRLEPGERLLLCTDGLWRVLSDEVIFDCLRGRSLHDAVETVVRRANAVADDNLTVLLIEGSG